ncbi:hypothetical protein [Massilia horti]|uniref:Uncharacterized protein n=1 Tax=Massilia horti TaxID=2562153 RepID=A0A4Y9SUH5_9BURK|nr:hypothetical protein [Massilia horti]TFW28406.1 hypothetical protein E4O92_21515 [Massilia horti]
MKTMPLASIWLRARLLASSWSPVAAGAALLLVLAIALLLWLVQARDLLARQHDLARRMAALPPPVVKAAPPATANQNLAAFYDALGERRYAEQQVRSLFGLASKAGLVLHDGEYKMGYDRNARVYTYQVNLPLKGSYRALWQFAMDALLAIPFASLDEISFRRDAIGEANVEARMRLTLYLTDAPRGGGQ